MTACLPAVLEKLLFNLWLSRKHESEVKCEMLLLYLQGKVQGSAATAQDLKYMTILSV